MQFIVLKYLVTAGIVVLDSEVAKNFDKAGMPIAALPLLTFFWCKKCRQTADLIPLYAAIQSSVKNKVRVRIRVVLMHFYFNSH